MRRSHKPISKCHSCKLNLDDHCWVHENLREQWGKHQECPCFENSELYAQFEAWQRESTVKPRRKPTLSGSRKHPKDYQPRQPVDRRRLDEAERERVAGLLQANPEAIVVSAKEGTGLNQLKRFLSNSFADVPKMIGVS